MVRQIMKKKSSCKLWFDNKTVKEWNGKDYQEVNYRCCPSSHKARYFFCLVLDRKEKGINLLIDLKIDKALNLNNLKNITPCDDLIGIWAQINVDDIYPFTKVEKHQMKKIRELLNLEVDDPYNLYTYG